MTTLTPCPRNVSEITLFDWRDGLLAPAEREALEAHVATCPTCRAHLDDFARARGALRGQQVPALRQRIWQGFQAEIRSAPKGAAASAGLTRAMWTGGLVVLLGLVVLASGYLFASHLGHAPTTSLSTTPTPRTVPTATPLQLADSPILTPEQAWGTANAQAVPTCANGTVTDVLPDGSGIVCVTPPDGGGAFITIAMPNRFDTLDDDPYAGDQPVAHTDGRYVVWVQTKMNANQQGVAAQSLAWFDRQNLSHHTLPLDTNYALLAGTLVVSHGHALIAETGATARVLVVELATETVTTVPDAEVFAADWPYIVSAKPIPNGQGTAPVTMANLQTGQKRDVTAYVSPVNETDTGTLSPLYQLQGDTLFSVLDEGTKLVGTEVAHVFSPRASPQKLFTLNTLGNSAVIATMGTRLLMVSYLQPADGLSAARAWVVFDLVQRRLVQITSASQGNVVNGDANVVLNGDAIAYGGVSNGSNRRTYIIRTTTTLPAKPVQP